MANSKTSVTEGSGKNIATYSFSEDALTKEVQRVVLNTSTGTEVAWQPPGIEAQENSSPVVISSDQFGLDSFEIAPISVTSATVIFTQDMTGWDSVAVQVTSAGTTCTITYETSNDNSNWVSTGGYTAPATGGYTTTSANVGIMVFPKRGRYFRARVSTYGSGTVTAGANFFLAPHTVPPFTVANTNHVAGASSSTSNLFPSLMLAQSANPTAVTNGQWVRQLADLLGRQVIQPYAIPENSWSYAAASGGILNTTTAVTIKAAAGAGVRNYLTSLQISSEALTNATELAVQDGASGTVIWRGRIGTSGLPLSSINFEVPLRGTANTLLEVVTLTASGAGAVFVNAQGFTSI